MKFHSLKEAKTDADQLNKQVSITAVDASVINRLEEESTRPELFLALARERERYGIVSGPEIYYPLSTTTELTIPAGEQRSASDSSSLVNPDGTIFYPYTGRINVDGQTVNEIRDNITSLLSEFIKDPQIEVKVAQFNSKKFIFVTGTS